MVGVESWDRALERVGALLVSSVGRGGAYQRARKQLLAGNPVCAYCRERAATTADHVPPLASFADPALWDGRPPAQGQGSWAEPLWAWPERPGRGVPWMGDEGVPWNLSAGSGLLQFPLWVQNAYCNVVFGGLRLLEHFLC